ncbi:hypothetical protein OB13_10815 [Pontibacter sp. HJ8]
MVPFKILLVHNRFRWAQPITYLSLFIRVFTCSKWNHIAIEQGDVIESIAKGVTPKTRKGWESVSDRIVLPLEVPSELLKGDLSKALGKPYGVRDLLRVGWHIILSKWFGLEPKPMKNGRGYICSELAAMLLGMEHPHLVTPADFEHMPFLKKGEVFETKKL